MKKTMNVQEKQLKKFVGEKAYKVIRNVKYDVNILKKALVTPNNARAVFEDMSDIEILSFVSQICNVPELIKIEKATQEEIKELFAKGGYDTVYFDDYEKIKDCKKYYAEGERICTYNNLKGRMHDYNMIVALKKDIDKIKREDVPTRDGIYGTSIINFQLSKNGSFISIKNRYNHTVPECDNTFNSNLDYIYEGLHNKVLGYYDFVVTNTKKSYKNIVEINGIYLKYCKEFDDIYYGDFVLDAINGVRYADHSRYFINYLPQETWHNNVPLIYDFHNKEVINLTKTNLTKIPLLNRMLKEGMINSSHKSYMPNAFVTFNNATKQLLQSNTKALKTLHDNFRYDFQKPFEVYGFVGNFTANTLKKTFNHNNGLIIVCRYNELSIMPFINGKFTLGESYRKYIVNNIEFYYRKGDFETNRKSSDIIGYFLYQDEQYKLPIKPKTESFNYQITNKNDYDKSGNYMPNIHRALKNRLFIYCQKKRAEEVKVNDYTKIAEKLQKDFESFKNKIINALQEANSYKQYKNIGNVMGSWENFASLFYEIANYAEKATKKSFRSISEQEADLQNIQHLFKRLNNYLEEE